MNELYVILAILAVVLFAMGVIISIFQKRMMRINLDNTLSMTSNIEVNVEEINDVEKKINDTNHSAILKQCDDDELLNFIDDEIL